MSDGHFKVKKARILDSNERLEELKPHHLLKDIAGIAAGMTCVDLGCGTGTFSFPMVVCVGDKGSVYAVDDSAEMLDLLRTKQPPPNLKPVHRDAAQTGLSSGIADFCLLAFVLHEVKQPQRLTEEAFRLLKPGGKVIALEWKPSQEATGPQKKRRLSSRQIKGLLEKAGFKNFEHLDWSPRRHGYLAAKPAQDGVQ